MLFLAVNQIISQFALADTSVKVGKDFQSKTLEI